MVKTGKKILHFYNNTGSLENVVKFLENVQKKIDYLNLNIDVNGNKSIKITIHGPKDLQYLATQRLREFAERFLEN